MRLLIREYLSMLKERDELDSLVPDLLLSMGIEVIRRPQRGVPEHGVDVAGVGPDPKDGQRKLMLFTIKGGDIDRRSWDASGELQGVRRSLNDIRDAYLQHRVSEEHADLPKKIVLCCGGEMERTIEDRWAGYVEGNTGDGEPEYEFWGGDRLSVLIERHMLGENLFPESARKQIRKTISLVDENEHPPQHFYNLTRETLFERDLPTGGEKRAVRKRQRVLRVLNLSLNIVFHWSREADNLRPALLCAERAVLTAWDWMRAEDLLGCEETQREFVRVFGTYISVIGAFTAKITPHCRTRDGFFGQGCDRTEYTIRTFEAIGILGVACWSQLHLAEMLAEASAPTGDSEETAGELESSGSSNENESPLPAERLAQEGEAIAHALAHLIGNNPAALTPCYDEHAIDISLGLLALTEAGLESPAVGYVSRLARRIPFAYGVLGRHFPIATDSYEDLVAMKVGEAPPKEDLMEMSTLLPVLAHWHVVLEMPDSYRNLAEEVDEIFSETNLQMWYPGKSTDEDLYRKNAGRKSGIVFSGIDLPADLDDLRSQITQLKQERQGYEDLSCLEYGWPVLSLIASRHFRTPVLPVFWQQYVSAEESAAVTE
jgi:hypothetical protein